MRAMESKLSLAILVPVYNEQYLVEASLKRLEVLADSTVAGSGARHRGERRLDGPDRRGAKEYPGGIGSKPVARDWNGFFRSMRRTRGRARRIRTALQYADTDLVVIHDADLEYHPEDLLKMIPLFVTEDADAVYGSRFLASDYRRVLFFRHSLGNKLLTVLTNFVTDLNLTDMETCYKMVRTALLKSIPLESDRFGIEPEITIKLAKRDARIFELPIRYSGRTYGEGKKITWKDGVKALGALLKYGISDRIYVADEHGSEILARLNRAPRFTKWMADTIRPYLGERVLEIGAGIGNLTSNLVPRTMYWASDINPQYLDRLKKLKQTRPYLQVQYTDASAGETYPGGAVRYGDLPERGGAPGGRREGVAEYSGVATRKMAGPSSWCRTDPGCTDHWIACWVITVGIRGNNCKNVCERAGFRVEKVLKFNRIGAPGWWWNGRVLKKTTFGFWQIKLLNTLLPVVRPIDRFLPFPHLSWIMILRVDEQVQESAAQAATQTLLPVQGQLPTEPLKAVGRSE